MREPCYKCKFENKPIDREPCEHCSDEYIKSGDHPAFQWAKSPTRADRFRAMSVEEMAEFINGVEAEAIRRAGLFITVGDIQRGKEGWLDWLKQESEE